MSWWEVEYEGTNYECTRWGMQKTIVSMVFGLVQRYA